MPRNSRSQVGTELGNRTNLHFFASFCNCWMERLKNLSGCGRVFKRRAICYSPAWPATGCSTTPPSPPSQPTHPPPHTTTTTTPPPHHPFTDSPTHPHPPTLPQPTKETHAHHTNHRPLLLPAGVGLVVVKGGRRGRNMVQNSEQGWRLGWRRPVVLGYEGIVPMVRPRGV